MVRSTPKAPIPQRCGRCSLTRPQWQRPLADLDWQLPPLDWTGLKRFLTSRTTLLRVSVAINKAKASAQVQDHFKMFTARATTSNATTSEIASSVIIISFIHGRMAETSVGLKAVAVANEKWK